MTVNNLPVQLTSLIGRERELAEIERLVSTSRLVTITGSGGVGKTSLALHIAHAVRDTFADGVLFISLAAFTDSTLIIPTIVHSIGLAESPNKLLLDSLKEFLRDRQVLVLLDNFEQVISAAPLLTELLSACARLKLLVTSRETLHLQGEHEFPLAPLEFSNLALIPRQLSFETLLEYPSIALFVERAQAIQPDFKLTAENASAVAELCTRLDGLPLAIELAAARIKLLPPKTILARLQESSLNLLTGGARDAPARQQTLRNTIQWSYDLLNADEQLTFRWLSTFVGGCTLNTATKVIGQQLSEIHDKERKVDHWSMITLDLITSLVNKSLVRQAESIGEPRLGMLETIREFGQEQFAHTDELESAQRALADHYLSLTEEAEQHLTGREQRAWLNRLGREQDNLRAALRWGFEYHATDPSTSLRAGFALRLVGALWQYWLLRGEWSEGRRWLEEALSVASNVDVSLALRAKVVYAAAAISRHQYDIARARALCSQSITLYRALGDQEGLLAGLLQLCRILHFQGDYEPLRARLPKMLALAEELPDAPIKAQVFAELPVIAQAPSIPGWRRAILRKANGSTAFSITLLA
jgi:predicted ATPase